MTYEQALAFLHSRTNYEQRTPSPDDLKLDRMRALLGLLDDPHSRLRIIHVAGSKGKGSTSAMLASIFRQAGFRTGLFTSPHLVRFEERIQIDGQPISPAEMSALMGKVQPAVEALDAAAEDAGSRPTFFEVATALGFLHFAGRTDAAVLEVGLGGRFDSTNVCQPVVSLITSISFDHTQQLGNRLASIAMEKAGIVKPGRPAISGATAPEARAVIAQICRERQAPLQQLGVDFHYAYEPGQVRSQESGVRSQESGVRSQGSRVESADSWFLTPDSWLCRPRVQVVTAARTWPWMELALLGEHQAANAAVAVACVEQLRAEGWSIDDAAVAAGLAEVSWPARLEVVGRRPLVVLDCAHNVASAEAVIRTLQTSFPPARRLLVFAGSSDKDLPGMFRVLAPHFAQAFLTRFHSPRSVPPEQLADILRQNTDLPCSIHPTAAEAWQAAREAAQPDDLICVTGSVFLAGELRPLLVGA